MVYHPSILRGIHRLKDTMSNPRIIIECPICKKEVPTAPRTEQFPFCSLTCKNIDLGRWLDQRYAVDVRSGKLGLVDDVEHDTEDEEDDPTVH